MTERTDSNSNSLERFEVPVTANCVLKASRFCLEECGLYGEAQQATVVSAAMTSGEVAAASWDDEGNLPTVDAEETVLPQTVVSCKGPRKQFMLFGELTCRNSPQIDIE